MTPLSPGGRCEEENRCRFCSYRWRGVCSFCLFKHIFCVCFKVDIKVLMIKRFFSFFLSSCLLFFLQRRLLNFRTTCPEEIWQAHCNFFFLKTHHKSHFINSVCKWNVLWLRATTAHFSVVQNLSATWDLFDQFFNDITHVKLWKRLKS